MLINIGINNKVSIYISHLTSMVTSISRHKDLLLMNVFNINSGFCIFQIVEFFNLLYVRLFLIKRLWLRILYNLSQLIINFDLL